MRKQPLTLFLLPLVFLLLLVVPQLQAGVSGKISGEVYDTRTGEPIVGATVQIRGTNLATSTDEDGEYFIINIPVGKHDVSVNSIGHETITTKGVRVLVDLTTPVDFDLESEVIDIGEEVVVFASDPIIQRDLTESKVIFTSDRLRDLPNIVTVQSVLTNYPGVVIGRDEQLHVRGGRSGQVAYYFDGFSVQDPFYNTAGIHIMPSALEELTLTSGGYTAEYGEALSGVISAVTREGGSRYHGGIRLYEGVTHPYDVRTGEWGSLKRVGNRSVAFNFSGPVPGAASQRLTFFSAGEYLTDETSLPTNGSEIYTWTAKLAAQPTPRITIKTNASLYRADGRLYRHRDVNDLSYDFNLDGLPAFEKEAYLVGLTGSYNFNEQMIVTATINRFKTYTKQAPDHLMDTYWSDWPGYSEGTIDDDNYLNYRDFENSLHVIGFTTGNDFNPTFRRREAKYNSVDLSLLAQVNKFHQVKGGIEIRRYDINWDFKQFYNDFPYGEKYSSKPLLTSAYVQDKMEYRDFIMNAGLRMEYRNADISYNTTPQLMAATWKEAEAKWNWSPRLGVSFPVSEKSVMHFNYGFYYQEPRYTYLYTNLQGDISSGLPLLGNPDLEPEQTISYELGVDHLIGEDLRVDITAYYKDVEDLVTVCSPFEVAGNPVTQFTNGDYGSVKGFDVALEKLRLKGFLSGSISYGYMIATGNGSDATDPYYTYLTSNEDTLAPVGEFPLNFDQRHTVTAVLNYRVPRDWQGNLFGLTVPGAWGLGMVGHYGSGLPYTPTDAFGNRLGERNEGRLPARYTVDMRFHKDFHLGLKDRMFSFFVEVDNLFDRHNVINVYSRTGLADNDGQHTGAGLSLDQDELESLDRLYDHDPQNYSPPRAVRVGLEFNF